MPEISLIAAVDENFGLGKENHLLCHLPADLRHFKRLTLGKTIIMGRKTFNSIGKPLPQRFNIVVSHQSLHLDGVNCVHSLEEAIALRPGEELMIIGGESIFRQTLDLATKIYLTQIHHKFEADTFFPSLDPSLWHCIESTFREKDKKNPFSMTFSVFQKL